MRKIMQWYRGYLKCTFKNGDFERLFNMCHNHDIHFWSMKYKEGIWTAYLSLDDFWKIRFFLKKTRVRLRIIERHGMPFVFLFLKKRHGLWSGCIVCIFILYALTSCIWRIEYQGNSFYTNECLTKYLRQNEHISLGMMKSDINSSELEENLRLAFSDISWVSVRTEGTSLMISLEEMVHYPDKNIQQSVSSIYSGVDGEIVSMITRSGTPNVTIGDQVKAGDLLIDGVIHIYDDAMNVVEERMVGADGDVYVRMNYPVEYTVYFNQQGKKYEKVKKNWIIAFGNHMWNVGHQPSMDHSDSYICFSEIWSPIKGFQLQRDTYLNYKCISTLETLTHAKEYMTKKMSDMFHEFTEKGVQIVENNVRIDMYEDRLVAKGYLVLIQSAGIRSNEEVDFDETIENGEFYEYNRNDD